MKNGKAPKKRNKKIPVKKTQEPKQESKVLSYSLFPKKKTNPVPTTYRKPYADD